MQKNAQVKEFHTKYHSLSEGMDDENISLECQECNNNFVSNIGNAIEFYERRSSFVLIMENMNNSMDLLDYLRTDIYKV